MLRHYLFGGTRVLVDETEIGRQVVAGACVAAIPRLNAVDLFAAEDAGARERSPCEYRVRRIDRRGKRRW